MDKSRWPQREVLVRLVRLGSVKRSRYREPEIGALSELGWIALRGRSKTIYEVTQQGEASIPQRLLMAWPDWKENIAAVEGRGRDPYALESYLEGLNIVSLDIDVEELDPVMLAVLESAFRELTRQTEGLYIRITGYKGSKLFLELRDNTSRDQSIVDQEVQRLRDEVVRISARVRQDVTTAAAVRRTVEIARDIVSPASIEATERLMNLILVASDLFADPIALQDQKFLSVIEASIHWVSGPDLPVPPARVSQGLLFGMQDATSAALVALRISELMRTMGVVARVAVDCATVSVEQDRQGRRRLMAEGAVGRDLETLSLAADEVVLGSRDFVRQAALDSGRIAIAQTRDPAAGVEAFVLRSLVNL